MNLSEKEKQIVDSLINPNEEIERQYNWEFDFQQEILAMLLTDKVFLIQSINLIKPMYFVDKAHETICAALFEYFNKYGQMPSKKYLKNEMRERFPNDDKKVLIYTGEIEALTNGFISGLQSREACLDKIAEFAKEQSLRKAVSATLKILNTSDTDKWLRIEKIFKEALLIDRKFDMGLDYFQTLEERYDRMQKQMESKEVFVTGFDSIDSGLTAGGVCRGELASVMGVSGAGKSMLLVKFAIKNIIRGKKVLYVSLEMDQDKLARRFDSMLSREPTSQLMQNRNVVISALKQEVQEEEDKRRLIIKQFPAGTADMHMVRAYVSQLNLYGFKPDMLCLDYVGEFKDDATVKVYESRQRIVRDLRAFGVEENHATFTAFQANRSGREAQQLGVLDDGSTGDSYGMVRVTDALWTINQNEAEKAQGIGRLFVAKHRDGKSRYNVYFKQDRDTLDMHEISQETYDNLITQYKKKKVESVELDKVMSKNKMFNPNE